MIIAIVHHDADGIFSLSFIYKRYGFENVKPYFSTVSRLKRTLCKVIMENSFDNTLYICDIQGNEETVRLASFFNEVFWIDHHIWEKFDVPKNVKLIVEHSPSAASLVAKTLGIKDEISIRIINEIDTNNISSKESMFIRDLVGAIKWKFGKDQYKYLEELAKKIARDINEVLNDNFYNVLVEEFRNWLKSKENYIIRNLEFRMVKDKRLLIIKCKERIPTYYIVDFLNRMLKERYDYIAILYSFPGGVRIELRTQTGVDVNVLAKALGGGGRREASGATLRDYGVEEAIELLIDKLNELVG